MNYQYRLTYQLRSGNDTFVVKRVPRQFYDLSQRLASEFEGSTRLRVHTDCNQAESVLVFPYYRSTLLALLESTPEFSPQGRLEILRHVGKAIQELHNKDWIHLGIFPYLEVYCMIRCLTPRRYQTRQRPSQLRLPRRRSRDRHQHSPGRLRSRLQMRECKAARYPICHRQRHVAKPRRPNRERYDQSLGYLLIRPNGK